MVWVLGALVFISVAIFAFGNDIVSYDEYDDDNESATTNSTSSTNSTLVFLRIPDKIHTIENGAKLIKFVCEVENVHINPNATDGRRITFEWTKNLAEVERDKRVTIKTVRDKASNRARSTLKIVKLEIHDRGYYSCSATNGIDTISWETSLNVTADVGVSTFSSPTSHKSLKFGGRGILSEDITTVFPNAAAVFSDHDFGVLPKKDELEEAIKSGKMPNTFDLTPSGRMVGTSKTKYNASVPFCQVYRGKTCRKFLHNKYVFVQPPHTQKEIEQKLTESFLVISQSNDISSSCNKFASPSLCYSAFPLCSDPLQINTYQSNHTSQYQASNDDSQFKDIRNNLAMSLRRICKDDCLLLETELCSKEYAIAKRHPVIGQTLELEECQFLPDETEDSSRNCLGLSVDRESVNRDDTCFWDDGRLYRGVQNSSFSGRKCMRWSHQFHIPLSDFPELTGHNYCRNPGAAEQQPFCYVDQNEKELCSITQCAQEIGIYIAASLASLIIAIIVVLTTWHCLCRKKNKTARNLQNMNTPTADKNIYGNPGPNSPMEMNSLLPPNIPPVRNHHTSKNGYQNVPQYTYKEVAFVEELGEGAFGKVYKGELKTKTGKIFVAVKSLKENASAKTQADFQREIELISELKHPNIICLMGVVVKQEPMCMLFEFMSEGDLHEFLIANSPGEGKSLTQNQFLHIAIQIAQGMEYLSENHYVHRDLAARNCLVSKDLVVKISDFGLSRDMYSCDYYRVQSKSLLPVRWMPPESILYGKFTTESDVWSYGVVLWEIYSYGLQPYYGYNNQEVINMIRSRKLLPCPDACPSYCYALMVECWAELAIRRPSFGEISHRLRVWKQNGNSNGAYFKTPEKFASGSRSSHTSESQTVCPESHTLESSTTWERGLNKGARLNESQSSLTSRSSSLGNKTQSTSLSNEHNGRGRRSHHQRRPTAEHPTESLERVDRSNPKNTMVSSNGDSNFEIKITR